MTDLLPIGEVARRSGLTVSALRFYDGAGVLSPQAVDATSGYRRYAPGQVAVARLVAGLRRVGLPLAEIREAVEQHHDVELVDGLLTAHLRRLEGGLEDARREIARLRAGLGDQGESAAVRVSVAAAGLRRLIEAVAFAVGRDPDLPVLHGALCEIEPGLLRMVATDRYRLAVHEVEVWQPEGARAGQGCARGVVPAAWLAEVGDLLRGTDGSTAVSLALVEDEVSLQVGTACCSAGLVDGDFPDYRRLLEGQDQSSGSAVESRWQTTDLEIDERSGTATIVPASSTGAGPGAPGITVRHEFLLDAVTAAGDDPVLRLDGPISPLAVRGSDGALSLLMPIRPEGGAPR